MKYSLILIFTTLVTYCYSQTDTLVVAQKAYSGTIKKIYSDRLYFKDASGTDYLVMKSSIERMNIRNQKVAANGQIGWEYESDLSKLNGNYPEFKDTKYYLRNAGIQGIVSSVLIVAGSIVSYVGAKTNDAGAQYFGYVSTGAGFSLMLPASIFLLKAGKVKTYKVL